MSDEKQKYYIGVAPLTMIRVVPAGYVNVLAETPVPSNIDPDDLKRLLDEGFLAETEPPADAGDSDDEDEEAGSGNGPAKVKDILAEVGNDKDKAAAALAAERELDKPRPTLVSQLEAILTSGS